MLDVKEPTVQIAPAPRVLLPLAAACTGLTVKAMQRKIADGVWLEGREFHRDPRGEVLVDIAGVMRWVAGESAAAPQAAKGRRLIDGRATALYRHFAVDGRLLYVGVSLGALKRTEQHRSGSAWFADVAAITLQWFPDREAALAAEALAIKAERPEWNIVGSIDRRPTSSPLRAFSSHPEGSAADLMAAFKRAGVKPKLEP
jgi:predicted GIY-YIG superfamily endonuclease